MRERDEDKARLSPEEFRERYNPFDDDVSILDMPGLARSMQRDSDTYAKAGPLTMEQLDGILAAHGLRCVLATLRQLCDSRAQSDDWETEFSDVGETDAWKAAADDLENLVLHGAVDVR